jgi:hypothetical protein
MRKMTQIVLILFAISGRVIGPDEVLIFDVELVELIETDDEESFESFRFENLDLDRDGMLQRDEVHGKSSFHFR